MMMQTLPKTKTNSGALTQIICIKILFIVLSLIAAALLLPIKRLIEVKSLPTHRDSATLHSGVTDCTHSNQNTTPPKGRQRPSIRWRKWWPDHQKSPYETKHCPFCTNTSYPAGKTQNYSRHWIWRWYTTSGRDPCRNSKHWHNHNRRRCLFIPRQIIIPQHRSYIHPIDSKNSHGHIQTMERTQIHL